MLRFQCQLSNEYTLTTICWWNINNFKQQCVIFFSFDSHRPCKTYVQHNKDKTEESFYVQYTLKGLSTSLQESLKSEVDINVWIGSYAISNCYIETKNPLKHTIWLNGIFIKVFIKSVKMQNRERVEIIVE